MRKGLASLVVSLTLSAVPALAQRSTATIRGAVTDQSHAVIPGATVTVRNDDTGLTRSVPTNSAGLYSFGELPVGRYSIEVELSGFQKGVVKNIVLNVADTRAVDVQLSTGAITEVVTVEAPAVAVQTIGGEVAGLVTGEQVRQLPLNGRNFLQLTLLMPGVSEPDQNFSVKDKGLLGGSDLSVSGSGTTSNIFFIDGVNNNDIGSNRTVLIYPSVDAIEEFKIHRNSYGAEFGGASGAQVNIVTRGGTNEFHGSLFYFGRDDALNSINYFLKQAGQDKEKLSRHDFGWTLSGPIIKDKLHFFASQEWNREKRGTVRTSFVPNAQERVGDFSGPGVAGCSPAKPIDPLTGQPFPGNVIPADRISPAGRLLLQLFPLPNTTPAAGSCNNWVDSLDSPINWRQENIRLDWSLSDRTRLMMRYTQDSWQNNAPDMNSTVSGGTLWGDDAFPAVDSNWDQPGKSFVVQLNQTLGSKAVNTLQFSYSGNRIKISRGGDDPTLNEQINAAIPTVFPESDKLYGAERAHPTFWGFGGYGGNLWNIAPFENGQDLFIFKDDYSAVFGKHNFKAGGLFSYNKKYEPDFGGADSPSFWGATGLNGWGGSTGNILSDVLLRDMAFGFTEFSANRTAQQRWKDLEFYVADSWKVHPRVTLDVGLRYSNYFNNFIADDRLTNFDPALFDPALGNDPCNGLIQPPGTNWCQQAGFRGGTEGPNRSLYDNDNNLFAPRIGVVWDISGQGKSVIRAGIGRFFLRERIGPTLSMSLFNPPFNNLQTGTRLLDTAQPCDGCFDPIAGGRPSFGREINAATPNSWQWNLTYEREVWHNTTFELSYVGNKGNDLLRVYDVNQVRSGDRNNNGVPDRLEYVRAGDDNGAQAALRPYGVFGDADIDFFDHSGDSWYHSLQTQLVSHFGRGSLFQASYTWSRLIATDPLDDSSASLQRSTAISDLDNPDLDRQLARVHRKHVFNASLVLGLPTLEDKSSFVKHVFGDWEIASLVFAASGTPLSVYVGSFPGLGGGISGTGYNDNQRPNYVDGQPCRATSGPKEQILNPAAYTLTGFQLGTFGTAGRGSCEGPGIIQVDFALYKNIKVSTRVRAQLRFEVFNIFNRTNFNSQTVDNIMDPSSIALDAPLDSATRITGAEVPASFGQATTARDPRQAQFGIKLTF